MTTFNKDNQRHPTHFSKGLARGESQASMVAAILAAISARHSSIGLKPGLARQMASVSR
jgi:hypothetical protein